MVSTSPRRWFGVQGGRSQRRMLLALTAVGLVLAVGAAMAGASFDSPAARTPETSGHLAAVSPPATSSAVDRRPNIIVVYADDMRASDLSIMTHVRRRLAANGVSFTNSVVTTSACCPARATHLSGQYAHNTGVLHNLPPHGGYDAYRSGVQIRADVVPVWLRDAGYRTVLLGKFMNRYPVPSDPGEIPAGFTDWYGLYEGDVHGTAYGIYRQTRYAVRVRPGPGQQPLLHPARTRAIYDAPDGGEGALFVYSGRAVHQTEVFMDGAIAAVDQQRKMSAPMYLNVWLTAPHTGGDAPAVGGAAYPEKERPYTTRPAEPELDELAASLQRGGGLGRFALARSGSFNEKNVKDKPAFVRRTSRLTRSEVDDVEIRNALRLASLASVDRKIDQLLAAVDRAQRRTGRPSYVVFSSDGGYFLGEHRLPFEKDLYYGAATDVPLVIRGPGVQRGVEVPVLVANVDLASTLLALAGESPRASVDGRSLLPLLRRSPATPPAQVWQRRMLLLEGFHGNTRDRRYAGVRNRRWVYVEHYATSDGTVTFRELYDLRRDPGYERNLLHGEVARRTRAQANTMAAALRRLKDCTGRGCRAVPTPS